MKFPFEHGGKTETLSLQQILAKLYDADRTVRAAGAAGLTQGLQGQHPPADLHPQHARPRSPHRLHAAPLRRRRCRRATSPTRSRRRSSTP